MFILIFGFLAILAEILGTIGGFGSSLFFVPLASFFFDIKTVLGITALFHVFSNISKLLLFHKTIDWPMAFRMGVPAVITVIIGAWLTTVTSLIYAQLILAFFLILFSLLMLLKPQFRLDQSTGTIIGGGAASGFLAGFTGTGGAVRGLALAVFNLEKNFFVGTSAAIDMGVDLSRSIVYTKSGYIHKDSVSLLMVLVPVSLAGSYIGKRLLLSIPQERFKTLVLAMVLLVGITLLFNNREIFLTT